MVETIAMKQQLIVMNRGGVGRDNYSEHNESGLRDIICNQISYFELIVFYQVVLAQFRCARLIMRLGASKLC